MFQNITDESTLTIQNEILDVLEFWLPFVEVRNIIINSTLNDNSINANTINIDILFNIKQDPNTWQSVQLSVGEGVTQSESELVQNQNNTTSGGGTTGGGGGY